MITTLLIYFFGTLERALASALPRASDVPLPSGYADFLPYFHAGTGIIGFLLPLEDLFTAFSFFLVIQGVIISAFIFSWILHLITGRGGTAT